MTAPSLRKLNTNGVPAGSEGMDKPASSESPRAEAEERAWFDDIVELIDSPAVVVDQSHCTLFVNDRFCDFCTTGRASLVGRHIRDIDNGILYTPAIQAALAALQLSGASEGERRTQIDLPLAGGQTIGSTVLRLPASLHPANALLLLDLPPEWIMARKNLRALAPAVPPDPLAALSAEALCHDIRQPLQTLSLLQGVLATREVDSTLRNHIVRLREAIEALGGMLDILEDLQHPSAAHSAPRLVGFPIEPVLSRLRSEFSYHAEARAIKLRVVSSRAVVHSDSRSLEQLVRVLLLAAVKMTSRGKILLGCRRHRRKLRLEVWVSGEMLGPQQQQDILGEFHRRAPPTKGSGIVHAIVKPYSHKLGLSIKARSRPGTGLLFTADVPMNLTPQSDPAHEVAVLGAGTGEAAVTGVVAAMSDSPSDYEALRFVLQEAGHRVVAVRHDADQIELEAGGGMQPEVIVADFTVFANDAPGRLIGKLRKVLGPHTPAVVIVDEAWRAVQSTPVSDPVTYLRKPATPDEITIRVSQSLAAARNRLAVPRIKDRESLQQTTFIVDDDRLLLNAMSALLRARGDHVEVYSSAESFLESYASPRRGCLVVDDKLPGLRGVDLLEKLEAKGAMLPAIVITGHGDIAGAVRAMRVGAIDYIEKPVHQGKLLSAIDRALEIDKGFGDTLARRQELAARYATLTRREQQVMDLVANGATSKAIGRMLNISHRTVENHRAAMMKRLGAASLSDVIHAVMELRVSRDH